MAVTKNNFRKLIYSTKSKITDKELFTSEAFQNHLKRMAETASKRYNRPIVINVIWEPKLDKTAYTDDNVICINAACELLSKLPDRKSTRLNSSH